MRTFTAVEIPAPLRRRIGARTAALLGGRRGVRAVTAENLHVTVRFLGEVADDALPALVDDLTPAVAAVPAGRVRLAAPGTFPPRGRARVLWLGLDDPHATLGALEAAVSPVLARHGIPPERRPYRPHVTLARARDGRGASVLRSALSAWPEHPVSGELPVTALTIFASRLTPAGARYRALFRLSLGRGA